MKFLPTYIFKFLNVLTFFFLLTLALLLRSNVFPTYTRGFFCSDVSIRYPFKEEILSTKHLCALFIPFPLFLLFLTEFLSYKRRSEHDDDEENEEEDEEDEAYDEAGLHFSLPLWLSKALKLSVVFLFGGVCTAVLTDGGKILLGIQRPHFLEICKPNVTCESFHPFTYIENYECLGDSEKTLQARHSFPSGHASVSAYVSVFLSVYLSLRLPSIFLLRTFVLFTLLVSCLLAGLSRLLDNMHHGTDIIAGYILGTLTACLILFSSSVTIDLLLKGFFTRKYSNSQNSLVFSSLTQKNNRSLGVHRHFWKETRSRRTTMETSIS